MKLNLPSTWTNQKISTLFLFVLLHTNKASSGQAFRNCLASLYNDDIFYDHLLGFPLANNSAINKEEALQVCCTKTKCLSEPFSSCDSSGNILGKDTLYFI